MEKYSIDKQSLFNQLLDRLRSEAAAVVAASEAAREAATHEESKPENEYDTRGLEASYLASAQAGRAEELGRAIRILEEWKLRPFGKDDAIEPGALLEAECGGKRAFYFYLPSGAGIPLAAEGKAVLVVTPASRLGQEFRGKHVGDLIEVEVAGQVREYTILSIS